MLMEDRIQRLLQDVGENHVQAPSRRVLAEAREPKFLLSRSDVCFLKSVGIDPTRRARRRKSARLD